MKKIHVDENQSFYRRQFNCMQLDDAKEQIPTKKGTKIFFWAFMCSLIVSSKVPNIKDRRASATRNMISVSALGSIGLT